MEKLPPISTVPDLPAEERAEILDHLFEPCVPLHTLSLDLMHKEAFPSYDELIASIGMQLTDLAESTSTSDTTWLHDILAAHPRLGEKKVDSQKSSAEQAHLKAEGGQPDNELADLNARYESSFPGLRYVYDTWIQKLNGMELTGEQEFL